MDPASIVEDTEQTQFCPQTDRWTSSENLITAATDRRTDKAKPVYAPVNFAEVGV